MTSTLRGALSSRALGSRPALVAPGRQSGFAGACGPMRCQAATSSAHKRLPTRGSHSHALLLRFVGYQHVRKSFLRRQAGAEPLPPPRRQQAGALPPVVPESSRRARLESRVQSKILVLGMFLFCAALAFWAGNYSGAGWALIFALIVSQRPL
ncbi:hypothetical protein ABPG77_003287 [Micractinium sp. CCAP 211/92]